MKDAAAVFSQHGFVVSRPESEQQLVERAVSGDPSASERLLAAVRPALVKYCRARLGTSNRTCGSADDVAQEACFAVARALPGYRHDGKPFLAFAYGIAAHKVADVLRRECRDRSHAVPQVPDEPSPEPTPEDHLLRREQARWMARLMDQLPDRKREILVLRVVLGLSAQETAAIVGSTPGAVRVAQHRALALLRELVSAADVH